MKTCCRVFSRLLFLGATCISSIAFAVLPSYTLTDLGTLGGTLSFATGINSSGQVVGWADTSGNSTRHAFLYSNGTMTDIGASQGGYNNFAYGINASGQVVGQSTYGGGFLYSNGVLTDLPVLAVATSINDSGQIVGESNTSPKMTALLVSNGSSHDIGSLGNSSFVNETGPSAINNHGQVVGYSVTSFTTNAGGTYDGIAHAFLYDNNKMTDIGTLGGSNSSATGINEAGQIVGNLETAYGNNRAFFYDNGVMIDIGTLGGVNGAAYGINNYGQVIGFSNTASGKYHAFLWGNGTITDLNSLLPGGSSLELVDARSINDAGQIVGADLINGNMHAFLMTPTPATIPLPPTSWLVGLGLLSMAGFTRKRKVA